MAPKIAIIGAGSTVFARKLIGDLLRFPALGEGITLALMDVDPERLSTSEVMARRVAEACGARAGVEATGDRRAALDGADYVIACFQVGGLQSGDDRRLRRPQALRGSPDDRRHARHRRDHARSADDPGPASTSAATWRSCARMHCLLQYVNPMAMLCWAVAEASSICTVGLCHSVRHTAAQLAGVLGIDEGGARVPGGGDQPPRVLPVAAFRWARTCTRDCASWSRPTACRPRTGSGSRSCATSATS